jgi:hypothetical protein
MTKKRFKMGLAALGVLTVFLMALTALLLAPTLASADKNSGTGHQHAAGPPGNSGGSPNPVYFEHPDGDQTENAGWSAPGDSGTPCAGGAGSCAGQNADQNENPGSHYFDGPTGPSGDGGSSSGGSGGTPNDGNSDGSGSGFPGGVFAGGFGFSGGGSVGSFGSGDTTPQDHSGDPASGDTGPDTPLFFAPTSNPDPDVPPIDFNRPPFTDPPNPGGPPGGDPPLTLPDTHKVPEPLTLSLFAMGLAGSAALRRRAKSK